MDQKEEFKSIMGHLNNTKLAVERAQEDPTGFTEAQNHVKQSEEMLSEVRHNSRLNSEENKKDMQKAQDLLRLIEETNQAANMRK